MAITNLGTPKYYATEEDIEAFTQVDIDTGVLGEQAFKNWLIWVEKEIDDYTGINFKVTADETVIIDGNGSSEIWLPPGKAPIISITSIELQDGNGNWEAQTRADYLPADSGYQSLKNQGKIILDPNKVNSVSDLFYKGTQNVRIIGQFGYATTPADINWVAAFLVGDVINHVYQHPSEVSSERLGQYQVSYRVQKTMQSEEKVQEILNRYRGVDIIDSEEF